MSFTPGRFLPGVHLPLPFSGVSFLGVSLGNGDGTFQTSIAVPVPQYHALSVSAADIDADTFADLVVGTDGPHVSPNLFVMFGNGDGSFQTVSEQIGGHQPRNLATADMNGDTVPDFVMTSATQQAVSVKLGNLDGSLTHVWAYPTTLAPGASWWTTSTLTTLRT